MASSDYESFRQRLEEQLRADVELLHEAHWAKLRAYKTVGRAKGEIGAPWPPAGLQLASPTPSLVSVEAVPEKPKRTRVYGVLENVQEALAKVGEVFDKNDVLRVLDVTPNRTTLHRVLGELERDGVIAILQYGSAKRPNRYRKIAPAAAAGDAVPES